MSTLLRIASVLILAVTIWPGSGCTRQYNGSLGLSTHDYKLVQEYHRTREEKQLAKEAAAGDRSRDGVRINPHGELEVADPGRLDELDRALTPRTEPTAEREPRPEQPDRASRGSADAPDADAGPDRQGDFVSTDAREVPSVTSPVSPFGNLPASSGAVSPLDSTGQIRRVSFTKEGADFDVTLDAAGQFMVYSSTRHRQTSDIYRQRIDGSAITQLTDDPSNDVMPALSPDGETIAFASDRSGNWDLYLMDADGGPAVQLTSDTAHDIHPSFSPDGKTLVYCTLGQQSGQWEMVTIDVDNPTTKRYIGHGLFPQWSPKGRTILYQRARERGTRWFSVWSVELDDRGEAGSPTELVWSSEYACITPSWSSDGKAVVFCTVTNPDADTQGRPVDADLWLARADGSGRTRLTRGRYANLQPVWSGDNAIYFVSNRSAGGVENIWAIDPDDAIQVAFPGKADDETQTADVPTPSD